MNTEGPVTYLVLHRTIKVLITNELDRIGRTSSFTTGRLADAGEVRRNHHATQGESDTSL